MGKRKDCNDDAWIGYHPPQYQHHRRRHFGENLVFHRQTAILNWVWMEEVEWIVTHLNCHAMPYNSRTHCFYCVIMNIVVVVIFVKAIIINNNSGRRGGDFSFRNFHLFYFLVRSWASGQLEKWNKTIVNQQIVVAKFYINFIAKCLRFLEAGVLEQNDFSGCMQPYHAISYS